MKRQQLQTFHRANLDEIDEEIAKLERKLVEEKMKLKMGELKNLHLPQSIAKDIARLKTIRGNKQAIEQTEPQKAVEMKKPEVKEKSKTVKAKDVNTSMKKSSTKTTKKVTKTKSKDEK
jgi:ribosomal protein L29